MAGLRSRPWLICLCIVLVAACFRSDLSLRAQARRQADRLAQQLAVDSGGTPGALDLSWLALYPEVRSARVATASGQPLGSYQAADPAPEQTSLYRSFSGRDAIEVELVANLPAWPACRTELPLLLLVTGLLALAIPVRAALPGGAPEPSPVSAKDALSLLSSAPQSPANLVLELDAALRIQRVSRGVERFGYSAKQLLGLPVGELIERFHPAHHDTRVGVARAGGGHLDSVVSSATILGDGGALEKVVVTLASPGQEGLQARYASLQQLCQAICDHARDAVLILDSSANVVYANLAFRGASEGRSEVGQPILPAICAASRLLFTNAVAAVLDGEPGENLEFAFEPPSTAIFEGAFHALTAETGAACLAVGIFRDVSLARQLAQELESARRRAGHSQKIEALGRMAGGVAHDFNNLLATMVFNLEAARAAMDARDPALAFLEEMQLATDRACAVTRQLLLYSRKKPLELCRVSCHEAIKNAVRLTQGSRGAGALHVHLAAGADEVLIDDGQIEQILVNLLVNARDALSVDEETSPNGRIEISTENIEYPTSHERGILLRVKDNGPGIPKELQAKIFEPYFTTKEVGKGTGLGLSTALAMVEKAGGQMVLAEGDGGACFEIRLPLAAAVAPALEPKPKPLETVVAAEPFDASVLLVEDETSIRTLLHRLLEQRGYRVTSAATGSAAAEILNSQNGFDILVTDLVLPGLSGSELAKIFLQTRPDRPVLFMSGFPGDTLDETQVSGNSRFLAKPFSHDQLLGSLRQLLGQPV